MADRPTLADLPALVKKIGYTPTGDEATRAQDCLVDASELIRDVAGVTWLTADGTAVEDVPAAVERICVTAAFRGFDNGRGLSQRSIGDSSVSWDRTGREGGDLVYLTDDEERRVRKAAGRGSAGVVTLVSPYSGDDAWSSGLIVSLNTP